MKIPSHGIVSHPSSSNRKTDFLYRISLKCLVRDDMGKVLVVKEAKRDWWDLPGGGMDHGEDIKAAIAREVKEEANLKGDFAYRVIDVDEPAFLNEHNFWQLRLIFEVSPTNMTFTAGEDSDEVAFIDPAIFKKSQNKTEQRIYRYSVIANKERVR